MIIDVTVDEILHHLIYVQNLEHNGINYQPQPINWSKISEPSIVFCIHPHFFHGNSTGNENSLYDRGGTGVIDQKGFFSYDIIA